MRSLSAKGRKLLAIAVPLIVAGGVVAAIVAGGQTQGEAVRVERDVRYAGPAGPALDVYRPAGGGGRRPAVLVLHGGSWWAGDRADVEPTARALARAGFAAFAVGYTLATEGRAGLPRQLRQVRAAVRFARRNARRFGVDPRRIGAVGISAGAHLAALAATAASGPLEAGSRLGTVVAWSGPFALRSPALRRVLAPEIANFLGCRGCPRRAKAASPLAHVSADDPPMLIVNSRRELVPAGQARRMARRLRRAGVPARLLLLPGSLHAPLFEPAVIGPTVEFLRVQLQ